MYICTVPGEGTARGHAVQIHPHCIVTTVSAKALEALIEAGGRGTYRDSAPWLVARDIFARAQADGERLPILFAAGQPPEFSHWAFIESLEVVELHRGAWETACRFSPLEAVHPIWQAIDSLFLKPGAEQVAREQREGIHCHRYPLTAAELHPYGLCETPPFIAMRASAGTRDATG
jgi:hypothetical protein